MFGDSLLHHPVLYFEVKWPLVAVLITKHSPVLLLTQVTKGLTHKVWAAAPGGSWGYCRLSSRHCFSGLEIVIRLNKTKAQVCSRVSWETLHFNPNPAFLFCFVHGSIAVSVRSLSWNLLSKGLIHLDIFIADVLNVWSMITSHGALMT